MEWTRSQQTAIDLSRRDVLVSSAAGSGKTASLTERVVRSVCRDDDPVDISRLLIVTFTENAAEELKTRLRKELENKSAKEPDNERIKKQLSLLPSASVSTIHSFYLRLIREGFTLLGLPPKLRIADEGVTDMIRHRVLDDVIDGYFNKDEHDGYDIENADEFFETFERLRPDDSLYTVFSELYNKAANYPEFLEHYKNCAEKYAACADDFSKSDHFRYAVSALTARLRELLSGYEKYVETYGYDGEFAAKYQPQAEYCEEYIKEAIKVLDSGNYGRIYDFFRSGPSLPRAGTISGDRDYKKPREALNKALQTKVYKACAGVFAFNEDDVRTVCLQTSRLCRCIYLLLCRFDRRFSREKLDLGIMDYNDTERFAYRLLCNKEFAAHIAEKYDEIYVDEYQDVNSVQNAIFSSISRNNRFMVGDAKQSIYAFRGSDPVFFTDYRSAFKPYSKDDPGPSVVFLSDNFRCGKPIIDFSNEVFGKLFRSDARIPYGDDDDLIFGKTAKVREDVPVKLTYIAGGAIEDEARFAAYQIKQLLKNGRKDSGEPVRLSDIAVLCRKAAACAVFERVLSEEGLSCVNTSDKSFFDAPEVLLTVSVLSAIDNPQRDVPLVSAMKSPLFGFTLDELAKIRLHTQNGPFYTAVQAYAEDEGDEKCKAFLRELSYLRYRCRSMPTDKFIRFFYKRTSVLPLLCSSRDGGDPADKRNNLLMLYEFAREFESESFKGLYGFISYCSEMTEKGSSIEKANDPSGKITVMTIHKSKGLQFPVCFVSGIGTKFNSDYNKKSIISDGKLGLAVRTKTEDGAIRTGPIYMTNVLKKASDAVTDEACAFYVALTRAEKYLFITASGADEPAFRKDDPSASYYRCSSFLDFLLFTLDGSGSSYEYACLAPDQIGQEDQDGAGAGQVLEDYTPDRDEYERLKAIYDYEYPYKEAARLPKKAAVSALYPEYLNRDADVVLFEEEKEPEPLILPDYYAEDKADDAASRGTATHLFMQFCDFDSAEKDVRAEAARLVGAGFIKAETAELVSYDEAERFFSSQLYKRMKQAKDAGRRFYREYRFNVGLDAAGFTSDPEMKKALQNETLLVQGVIDCFFEEEDGTLTVVDYKTDRVRGYGAEEELKNRYKLQLSYYKTALQRISLTEVGKCELYSFCLGRSVSL